jgi:hypothetical protein
MLSIGLCRLVLLQRAQLDAPIDQAGNNPKYGRVPGQLMTESLGQNLKFVQLRHRMLNNNPVFGKETVVSLLFFGQRVVSSRFKRQIQLFVRVVC